MPGEEGGEGLNVVKIQLKSDCYLLGLRSHVILNFKCTHKSPRFCFVLFFNEDRDGASDCIFNEFPGGAAGQ